MLLLLLLLKLTGPVSYYGCCCWRFKCCSFGSICLWICNGGLSWLLSSWMLCPVLWQCLRFQLVAKALLAITVSLDICCCDRCEMLAFIYFYKFIDFRFVWFFVAIHKTKYIGIQIWLHINSANTFTLSNYVNFKCTLLRVRVRGFD